MTKSQVLAKMTKAARALGWSAVQVQKLDCLNNATLERLLAVFRKAAGPNREDRMNDPAGNSAYRRK